MVRGAQNVTQVVDASFKRTVIGLVGERLGQAGAPVQNVDDVSQTVHNLALMPL